jgi:methyltransferase
MIVPAVLIALAFVPMVAEARLSSRHDRALRAAGAVEPPGDVYRLMQIAYPACFLAMAVEAWWRGSRPNGVFAAGLALFVAAKGLKYWAIATLATRWTFRILVPPGSSRVIRGPYRFIAHPNYVAVAGELLGLGLMAQAPVAATAAIAGFGWLLLMRIRIEEAALGLRS